MLCTNKGLVTSGYSLAYLAHWPGSKMTSRKRSSVFPYICMELFSVFMSLGRLLGGREYIWDNRTVVVDHMGLLDSFYVLPDYQTPFSAFFFIYLFYLLFPIISLLRIVCVNHFPPPPPLRGYVSWLKGEEIDEVCIYVSCLFLIGWYAFFYLPIVLKAQIGFLCPFASCLHTDWRQLFLLITPCSEWRVSLFKMT